MADEDLPKEIDQQIRNVIALCLITQVSFPPHSILQVAASLGALNEALTVQVGKVNELVREVEVHQEFLTAWNDFFKAGRAALNPSENASDRMEEN